MRRIVHMVDSNLGLQEASMLGREDYYRLMAGRSNLTKDELAKRGERKEVVLYYDRLGTHIEFGKEKIDKLRKEVEKIEVAVEEIHGVVAQRGIATGKVRLYIQGTTSWPDSDKGYVFIAKHTMPRDLPYMRNAAAIVTDEGGITSHTAIVAREMEIPCVIGTKIATKVLKDGDLVEVDAERGVVTIISKKK